MADRDEKANVVTLAGRCAKPGCRAKPRRGGMHCWFHGVRAKKATAPAPAGVATTSAAAPTATGAPPANRTNPWRLASPEEVQAALREAVQRLATGAWDVRKATAVIQGLERLRDAYQDGGAGAASLPAGARLPTAAEEAWMAAHGCPPPGTAAMVVLVGPQTSPDDLQRAQPPESPPAAPTVPEEAQAPEPVPPPPAPDHAPYSQLDRPPPPPPVLVPLAPDQAREGVLVYDGRGQQVVRLLQRFETGTHLGAFWVAVDQGGKAVRVDQADLMVEVPASPTDEPGPEAA